VLKTTIKYGLALAAGAFLLQWLEYQYAIRTIPTEGYIILIAGAFTALGIWAGRRLTRTHPPGPFQVNRQAIDYLRISERELQVLGQLAAGHSNEDIAERLFVSTSTVKTHLASLYRKLDVSSRTQAIQKARTLKIVP
jgi:DNA-binding CsgD family transcriptional regulator